ncbi:unnamed protein product [Candidula unifasciata]|uniref:Zinc transporter 1 n=1 Tax=Candidula unifasciata TaxID=100452 RepID=A0A8S4A217_9EUPU|nr:unnamed protein product [Candidula unifasciata]
MCKFSKTCRLMCMLLLTSIFFLLEIVVGYLTNSVALIADSFHMLSDVVALVVAFASVRISKWPSKRNTYGWVRAEILGALVNAVFLLALCFSITVEAFKRLVKVEQVEEPILMLIVGGAGLLVNILGLCLFRGHAHSHGGSGHSHGGHAHSHGGSGHSHGGHAHSHGGSGHSHGGHAHSGKHHRKPHKEYVHSPSLLDSPEGHKHAFEHLSTCHKKTGNDSPQSSEKESLVLSEPTCTSTSLSEDKEIYMSPNANITIEIKKPKLVQSQQLNMRGIFLHVLADALGSVVVIISGLIITLAEGDWRYYVDPSLSIILVIIILGSTIPLLKESAFILLQTVPSHVNVDNIIKELEEMEGIYGVHECHIWQLAGNRIIASAHIRCHGIEEYMTLAANIKKLFHKSGIHSTTIQPEFIDYHDRHAEHKPCVLVCDGIGEHCRSNTCCGDKLSKQNNANNSTDKSVGSSAKRFFNMNNCNSVQPGAASIRSLDMKFSRDGDEVVLEMFDTRKAVIAAAHGTRTQACLCGDVTTLGDHSLPAST